MFLFLSINIFPWISSILVGFFKSSRYFCVTLFYTVSDLACLSIPVSDQTAFTGLTLVLEQPTDGGGNTGTFFLEKRSEIFVLLQKARAI